MAFPRIVFIASGPHSGSTVMDLTLGAHPRFVGLGEVYSLVRDGSPWLDRPQEVQCSCGHTMDACPFWSGLLPRLRELRSEPVERRYAEVFRAFAEMFGPDRAAVDSSKALDALRIVQVFAGNTLQVIHLLRDVRSWTVSIRDVRRRDGEFSLRDLLRKYGVGGVVKYLRQTSPGLFFRWYYETRRRVGFVQSRGISTFALGYEELALYPDVFIPQICRFLGVEMAEGMMRLQSTGSHNVLGNRMRHDPDKRERILYDSRWLWRREWRLPFILLPGIMQANYRWVYGRLRDGFWD